MKRRFLINVSDLEDIVKISIQKRLSQTTSSQESFSNSIKLDIVMSSIKLSNRLLSFSANLKRFARI